MKFCHDRSSLFNAQNIKQEKENSGDECVKYDIYIDSSLAGPDGA